MEEILLQAENLCYSYGQGKQVLKEINITVRKEKGLWFSVLTVRENPPVFSI